MPVSDNFLSPRSNGVVFLKLARFQWNGLRCLHYPSPRYPRCSPDFFPDHLVRADFGEEHPREEYTCPFQSYTPEVSSRSRPLADLPLPELGHLPALPSFL